MIVADLRKKKGCMEENPWMIRQSTGVREIWSCLYAQSQKRQRREGEKTGGRASRQVEFTRRARWEETDKHQERSWPLKQGKCRDRFNCKLACNGEERRGHWPGKMDRLLHEEKALGNEERDWGVHQFVTAKIIGKVVI